ncbi:MAG: hypothetical protein LBF37_03145 [Rickettsiales bacterium]|nr:hypothetical protein [Rickettsiales bacterium]
MLERIKQYWTKFWGIIVIACVALAYFFGKKRGKAQNNKAVLANVSRANRARRRLDNDPVIAKRVRKNTPVNDFCLIYRPIYSHPSDTEITKQQIDQNNVVFDEICAQ